MRIGTAAFLIGAILGGTATAATIEVPADQPSVQAGIDAAVHGDTVLVAPGLYTEGITFSGKNITVASHYLFADDPAFITDTIIDAGSSGSVVRFENGETADAILVGFTLTGGDAEYGGGIHCAQSSPTLRGLVISGNQAIGGGGIHCQDRSSPRLEEVIITDNAASISGGGGGMRCVSYSAPVLQDVRIEGNSAQNGGGLYCYLYADPVLVDVVIRGNTATSTLPSSPSGGGVFCGGFSNPRMDRVTITDNIAGSIGGNLSGRGGGIFCSGGSSPLMVNTTISRNIATFAGGGVFCLSNAAPRLVNGILWGDSPQEIYFDGSFAPNTITVAYSDVAGGESGIAVNGNGSVLWLAGNIDQNPEFVDVFAGDYQLLEGSPCIDAGTAFLVLEGDTLISRDPAEYVGPFPDMGAFEFNSVAGVPHPSVETPSLIEAIRPNPFAAITSISYRLDADAAVSLAIYDALGREVATVVRGRRNAGVHEVRLDGANLSVGVYFARLQVESRGTTGNIISTQRLIRSR